MIVRARLKDDDQIRFMIRTAEATCPYCAKKIRIVLVYDKATVTDTPCYCLDCCQIDSCPHATIIRLGKRQITLDFSDTKKRRENQKDERGRSDDVDNGEA